jgi:hypothetical protein
MQNTAYLSNSTYAQLMAQWVADADPVSRSDLKEYCSMTQPDEASAKDLVVQYSGLADYTTVAKLLPPMLPDVKVSRPALSRPQHLCQ